MRLNGLTFIHFFACALSHDISTWWRLLAASDCQKLKTNNITQLNMGLWSCHRQPTSIYNMLQQLIVIFSLAAKNNVG